MLESEHRRDTIERFLRGKRTPETEVEYTSSRRLAVPRLQGGPPVLLIDIIVYCTRSSAPGQRWVEQRQAILHDRVLTADTILGIETEETS